MKITHKFIRYVLCTFLLNSCNSSTLFANRESVNTNVTPRKEAVPYSDSEAVLKYENKNAFPEITKESLPSLPSSPGMLKMFAINLFKSLPHQIQSEIIYNHGFAKPTGISTQNYKSFDMISLNETLNRIYLSHIENEHITNEFHCVGGSEFSFTPLLSYGAYQIIIDKNLKPRKNFSQEFNAYLPFTYSELLINSCSEADKK